MPEPSQAVIVLHGLANTPLTMARQAKALRLAGYDVFNWGYNSLKGSMHEQMARLEERLPALRKYEKVHGIGHSLGGLLLRGLFARNTHGLNLGRLVMQGSPNNGAGIVKRFHYLFKGPLNRQIIHDLAEGSPAIAGLGIPKVEIGIIAGVEPFNAINPITWLNCYALGDIPHDGTVEAANTRLPDMMDYLEVPVNHLALPFRTVVIEASLEFVKNGKFAR